MNGRAMRMNLIWNSPNSMVLSATDILASFACVRDGLIVPYLIQKINCYRTCKTGGNLTVSNRRKGTAACGDLVFGYAKKKRTETGISVLETITESSFRRFSPDPPDLLEAQP